MAAKDPKVRSRVSRYGALCRVAQGRTTTRVASNAFMARFERQVDPDGLLDPPERARRAEAAKRAYFTALARRRYRK